MDLVYHRSKNILEVTVGRNVGATSSNLWSVVSVLCLWVEVTK